MRRETHASARSITALPTGFPLALVGAVDCVTLRRHVIVSQCHEIASAQFAVYRQVEKTKPRARNSSCNLTRMEPCATSALRDDAFEIAEKIDL
jgi:hypothetical protein